MTKMISQIYWILVLINTRMVQCFSLNSFNPNDDKISVSNIKINSNIAREISNNLDNNLVSSYVPKGFNLLLKALNTRNSNNLLKSRSLDDLSSSLYNDEPHFFCGETLSNAVEYYCINIKGTSVYGSGSDDDDYNFVIRRIKSKREKTIDEYKDHFLGNLNTTKI